MPGPGNKGKAFKSKAKRKPVGPQNPAAGVSKPLQCQTLEADEMTCCDKPATDPRGQPERCRVHQSQYRTLCKKYKEASKVVDDIKQSKEIPTKEQINRHASPHAVLEKARWLREYLEAIRVERTGRDIHQRRFFLKADDGHKIRLKVLAKEMGKAVEGLDALYTRASELHFAQSTTAPEWVKLSQTAPRHDPPPSDEVARTPLIPSFVNAAESSNGNEAGASPKNAPTLDTEDDDLIDVELHAYVFISRLPIDSDPANILFYFPYSSKARMLRVMEILWEPEAFLAFIVYKLDASQRNDVEYIGYVKEYSAVIQRITCQYARRIICHQPALCYKAIDKVSFKDLFLSDEVTVEDIAQFFVMFIQQRLALGLLWLKDATIEGLAMSRPGQAGTVANVGDPKNRYSVLGGWIFNRAHVGTMSNEAWFYLIKLAEAPANVENRFVRLCNNFDDIISFLSFAAIGMVPAPSFCSEMAPSSSSSADSPPYGAHMARQHLSLSGVVITDMVSAGMSRVVGPFPNRSVKAKKPGCIVWSEVESRAYMFGALRNEPDTFTDAFLRELHARPDLFQVVTRSETDPERKVELFGDGEAGALPNLRFRTFESPPASLTRRPTGYGPWVVARSAVDILYGSETQGLQMPRSPPMMRGYLTQLDRQTPGWFFRFKKFPVKYIVILDAIPYRHHSMLAMQVAWAALRAGGYAEGEYNFRKYARASDQLFEKCASERLGWQPKTWPPWGITKLEDDE